MEVNWALPRSGSPGIGHWTAVHFKSNSIDTILFEKKRKKLALTDADWQFGWCPSAIGLTVSIGSTDQIESRRTIIRHLEMNRQQQLESVFVQFIEYLWFWLPSRCQSYLHDSRMRDNLLRDDHWQFHAVRRKSALHTQTQTLLNE